MSSLRSPVPRPRARSPLLARLLVALTLATCFFGIPAPSAADVGDFGHMGPTYVGTDGNPTGEKPESKLWWNDGFWWASMWSTTAAQFKIFRLNVASQTWVETATVLDTRSDSHADTLWDAASGKLYVSSHRATANTGPNVGWRGMLWRYSYAPATDTYTLDAGFPADINQAASEALVIDRDSTGQLWAAWVQQTTAGSGIYRVYVNRTVCDPGCNDAVWGTPFEHPASNTDVDRDDIASLIAYRGRVGVMWSNQLANTMYFSIHQDTAADETWGSSIAAFSGPNFSDDHINLKSLVVGDDGRIYAVIKTGHTSDEDPSIVLLVREPGSGSWTSNVVWKKKWDLTRPIVMLDETANRIHVFAATEQGGSVYEKSTLMTAISFADTVGTPVIRDADKLHMNDPTSTKQNVNSTTGLVVLASNDTSSSDRRYWHHHDPLGGTPPPNTAPLAANDTYAATQAVTLNVAAPGVLGNDTDTDGDALTAAVASGPSNGSLTLNPNGSFSYTPSPAFSGADSFTYTASDGDLTSAPATVNLNVAPAGGGSTSTTFTPSHDGYVWDGSANKVFNVATLRTFGLDAATRNDSYLKFTVANLAGSVSSAVLRLFVVQGQANSGDVYAATHSTWSEASLTWNNQPGRTGSSLGTIGPTSTGTWVEIDVSALVTANGTYSLVLYGLIDASTHFSSSEGSQPPQLVVTTGS